MSASRPYTVGWGDVVGAHGSFASLEDKRAPPCHLPVRRAEARPLERRGMTKKARGVGWHLRESGLVATVKCLAELVRLLHDLDCDGVAARRLGKVLTVNLGNKGDGCPLCRYELHDELELSYRAGGQIR